MTVFNHHCDPRGNTMTSVKKSCLLIAIGGALLAAGCRDNPKDTSTKNAIAVYSDSDGLYSETVALRPDGTYVQSEKQQSHAVPPGPQTLPLPLGGGGHTGTWRLLDGPGGKPLPLPTTAAALPRGAVVELHKAMPFGLTWENQPPALLQTDRTIPASAFSLLRQAP